MSSFISPRRGGVTLWSSSITGPGFARSHSTHWRMMRFDWRISATRHEIAVVAVAIHADRHLEVDAVVGRVRLLLAQVPGNARPAQHRAGEAELQRALGRDDADVDGALLPDPVVGQQRLVLVDAGREAAGEVLDEVEQRSRARGVAALRGRSGCGTSTPCTAASSPAGRGRRRPAGSRSRACACPRPPRSSPSGPRARGTRRGRRSSRRCRARASRSTSGDSGCASSRRTSCGCTARAQAPRCRAAVSIART